MYRIGRWRLYAAIIITILLESTILNLIEIGNIKPDLMLILIIFVGLYSNWRESLEAGVVGGLLKDVISVDTIGVNLILLGLCGLLASYCKNKVFKENLITQLILTLILAMGINILGLFIKIVTKDTGLANIEPRHIASFLMPICLYTALFSPPTFFCLKRLFRIKELEF